MKENLFKNILLILILNYIFIINAQQIENQEINLKNNEKINEGTQTDEPEIENNIKEEKGEEDSFGEENNEEKEVEKLSCGDPEFKYSPPCVQPEQEENRQELNENKKFESNEIPKPKYPKDNEKEEKEKNNEEINEGKEENKEKEKNNKIIEINKNNNSTTKGEDNKKPTGFWQKLTCLLINFNCPDKKQDKIENKNKEILKTLNKGQPEIFNGEDELGSLENEYELSGEYKGKLNEDFKQLNATMKFNATFIKSEIDESGKQYSNITHFDALMHN
ncbi:hypothetical protein Mgra_00007862 [Meloidogyne graminicola]|uniref:Uncharacterized protein n=1 Tax=Meloidogyne graminicola TaxID=189291 RepID=A0A8S9ZHK2_9BILA|nr:hypothetical protein Mgra_00007862 [Meloidogyne graminicola]